MRMPWLKLYRYYLEQSAALSQGMQTSFTYASIANTFTCKFFRPRSIT